MITNFFSKCVASQQAGVRAIGWIAPLFLVIGLTACVQSPVTNPPPVSLDSANLEGQTQAEQDPDRVAEKDEPIEWVNKPRFSVERTKLHSAGIEKMLRNSGRMLTDKGRHVEFEIPDVIRNFEKVVFYQEQTDGRGGFKNTATRSRLERWQEPIRVQLVFGDSVSQKVRERDTEFVTQFVERLSRVSQHDISMADDSPNLIIYVLDANERANSTDLLVSKNKKTSDLLARRFGELNLNVLCAAFMQQNVDGKSGYSSAAVLVKSEHSELMRRSCYHEEISQSMGLINDHFTARPSIFNDDEEFAYLTYHDEILLQMLYNPRLRIGMSWREAKPIVEDLAEELLGQEAS